nr:unnamed protein product [Rangifer tarandus platyrhynchus]
MPVVPKNELCTPEEHLQGQIQAQGPVEAQLLGVEAEDASTPLATSPPISSSSATVDAEISLKQTLNVMVADLVEIVFLKYGTKEPIFQAEMLNTVLRDNQAHFPVVFHKATQCLQFVFGLDMKEVDHREHIYVMITTLGRLTLNDMQRDGQSMPKAGLVVSALTLILLAGDQAIHQASECLQLVFSMDVREVDHPKHIYVLVPTLGLTCNGMVSDGHSMPKASNLVVVLGMILLEGNCAHEEEIWETLNDMGIYVKREHYICGEPREC